MCAGVLRRQCKHWNEQGRKKKKDTGIQRDPKKLWKGLKRHLLILLYTVQLQCFMLIRIVNIILHFYLLLHLPQPL